VNQFRKKVIFLLLIIVGASDLVVKVLGDNDDWQLSGFYCNPIRTVVLTAQLCNAIHLSQFLQYSQVYCFMLTTMLASIIFFL
jgi:hypothetical protein